MRSLTPKDLGALVRDTRINNGLSQTQLGERIGASRYWVAEIEHGKSGAELGLTLKALRVLNLVITVEPKDVILRRQRTETPPKQSTGQASGHPIVDLSAILKRSITPK